MLPLDSNITNNTHYRWQTLNTEPRGFFFFALNYVGSKFDSRSFSFALSTLAPYTRDRFLDFRHLGVLFLALFFDRTPLIPQLYCSPPITIFSWFLRFGSLVLPIIWTLFPFLFYVLHYTSFMTFFHGSQRLRQIAAPFLSVLKRSKAVSGTKLISPIPNRVARILTIHIQNRTDGFYWVATALCILTESTENFQPQYSGQVLSTKFAYRTGSAPKNHSLTSNRE